MRGDQRCPCGCHWNWSWLNEAFKGTQISVSDIDGVVERYGSVLLIEAKQPDEELTVGQRILMESMTYKDRISGVVVYGPRDTPQYFDLCKEGEWVEKRHPTSKSDFFKRVSRWFDKVNRF